MVLKFVTKGLKLKVRKFWELILKIIQEIFQILDNYTRKIVIKTKMREISKKYLDAGGRQYFSSKCERLDRSAKIKEDVLRRVIVNGLTGSS